MPKQYLRGLVSEVTPEKKSVRVIASTGAVDRQGESINPDGWVLDNFKSNPVLLWSHDAYELPIGKVANIGVDSTGALIADMEFASDISDKAAQIELMVRAGYLNAVSVGFMPLEFDNQGRTIKQELLELSVVNVPANQEALVTSRAFKSFDEMVKTWEKQSKKKDIKVDEVKNIDTVPAVEEKVGRVLSEANRNEIRLMIEACKNAVDTGTKLLESTTPPERRANESNGDKVAPTPRLRSLRMLDRVVEGLIREEKAA